MHKTARNRDYILSSDHPGLFLIEFYARERSISALNVHAHKITRLKNNVVELITFYSTRGVPVTIGQRENAIQLHFDSAIYSDGFNKKVFEQVIHYLKECVEKAKELID